MDGEKATTWSGDLAGERVEYDSETSTLQFKPADPDAPVKLTPEDLMAWLNAQQGLTDDALDEARAEVDRLERKSLDIEACRAKLAMLRPDLGKPLWERVMDGEAESDRPAGKVIDMRDIKPTAKARAEAKHRRCEPLP